LLRRLELVEPLDLAVVDRDDLGLRPGVLERLARLLQLNTLEHVRRQDRDLLALELLLGHRTPFVGVPSSVSGASGSKRDARPGSRPSASGPQWGGHAA